MKLFNHTPCEKLPEISEDRAEDGRRWYHTPEGVFPSVTTVLGWHKEGSPTLAAWRQRVGNEEADRVSQESTQVGNVIHEGVECFLRDTEHDSLTLSSLERGILRSILPVLLLHVDNIHGQELGLYSAALGLAGRTDIIAEWDGVLSVIDLKNSRKPKKKQWVNDYNLQVTSYAEMYRERTGIEITQGIVLVGVWGKKKPQIFKTDTRKKLDELRGKIKEFNMAVLDSSSQQDNTPEIAASPWAVCAANQPLAEEWVD